MNDQSHQPTPPPPGETPRVDRYQWAMENKPLTDREREILEKARRLERELNAAQAAVRELCGVLQELSDAMRRYEADVDTEAPSSHHRMMDRVRNALAKHAPKENSVTEKQEEEPFHTYW